MKAKLMRMILGPVETNVYILFNEGGSEAVIFDPADNGDLIYERLKENGLSLKAMLLTHGHFDHINGIAALKKLTGAPVLAPSAEERVLREPWLNCSGETSIKPDRLLQDGETVELCGFSIKCIFTPGHTEGSCCYYIKDQDILISGDTLFEGSVGRTDLPTGSMSSLVKSLKEKLLTLPDETQVFPGHGGFTTIGDEKLYNPYCI